MNDSANGEKDDFLTAAESLLDRGFHKKAQDLALDRLSRFPDDADARIIACHAWTRMGKLDKVKQMLREVDGAILSMSRIYARMGDICFQSGLNREAIAFYRRFTAINPDAPISGEIEKKLDSLLSSRPEANLGEDENFEGAPYLPGLQTVTMAELYIKQGHPDLALKVLEEILRKDSANFRAETMRWELLEKKGLGPEKPCPGGTGAVIRELNRWLANLHRTGSHAA